MAPLTKKLTTGSIRTGSKVSSPKLTNPSSAIKARKCPQGSKSRSVTQVLTLGSSSDSPSRTGWTCEGVQCFPVAVPLLKDLSVISVACGSSHTLVLDKNGSVWSFGSNKNGQLGRFTENVDGESQPTIIPLGEKVVQICAGTFSSLFRTISKEVYFCGALFDGISGNNQIYFGSKLGLSVPFPTLVASDIIKMAGGADHFLILDEIGTAYSFGMNSFGQLGRGKDPLEGRQLGDTGTSPLELANQIKELYLTPTVVKVGNGYKVRDVFCSENGSFFVTKKNGDVFVCGDNMHGYLGIRANSEEETDEEDVRLSNVRTSIGVSLEEDHGLYSDQKQEEEGHERGEVDLNSYVENETDESSDFSSSEEGQIDDPSESDNTDAGVMDSSRLTVNLFVPVKSPAFDIAHWKQIVGGSSHVLALSTKGELYAMGYNENGEVGIGFQRISLSTLVPLLPDLRFKYIAAGTSTSYAISKDRKLFGWGMGAYGQLTNGDFDDILTPTPFHSEAGKIITNVKCVAAGPEHSAVVIRGRSKIPCHPVPIPREPLRPRPTIEVRPMKLRQEIADPTCPITLQFRNQATIEIALKMICSRFQSESTLTNDFVGNVVDALTVTMPQFFCCFGLEQSQKESTDSECNLLYCTKTFYLFLRILHGITQELSWAQDYIESLDSEGATSSSAGGLTKLVALLQHSAESSNLEVEVLQVFGSNTNVVQDIEQLIKESLHQLGCLKHVNWAPLLGLYSKYNERGLLLSEADKMAFRDEAIANALTKKKARIEMVEVNYIVTARIMEMKLFRFPEKVELIPSTTN